MIEAQDRMILLSGQTAKRFHQNALHPPKKSRKGTTLCGVRYNADCRTNA